MNEVPVPPDSASSNEQAQNVPDAPDQGPDLLAAIDLGSNSFHMVIAQYAQGELRTVEKLGDRVQLASGLNKRNHLSEEAQQRGLQCLRMFAQRLVGVSAQRIRVVATNTLRVAQNRTQFLYRARQILGQPVEVVSGREEARLIFMGVVHSLPSFEGRRLVVDIGGGSTEFIIGEGLKPQALESLHMGCVSFAKQFFPGGEISSKNFQRAVNAARIELLNIEARYRRIGWGQSVGSSGTIKAVERMLVANGWTSEGITGDGLKQLKDQILTYKQADDLLIEGLTPERRPVIPAGIAILTAIFEAFELDSMRFSDGALREGVLYDLVGRFGNEDVRERTIAALQERYHVDTAHAAMVEHTALAVLSQVEEAWSLQDEKFRDWLIWAVRVHEIGMAISHSRFHRHGAYLILHSDLTGFSRLDQLALNLLVRFHRRKVLVEEFEEFPEEERDQLLKLCVVMRLSVLFHHSRKEETLPLFSLTVTGKKASLAFPEGWLDAHPLTRVDLEQEAKRLKKMGLKLNF